MMNNVPNELVIHQPWEPILSRAVLRVNVAEFTNRLFKDSWGNQGGTFPILGVEFVPTIISSINSVLFVVLVVFDVVFGVVVDVVFGDLVLRIAELVEFDELGEAVVIGTLNPFLKIMPDNWDHSQVVVITTNAQCKCWIGKESGPWDTGLGTVLNTAIALRCTVTGCDMAVFCGLKGARCTPL